MTNCIQLTRARLRSFAEAIGETDPRYTDVVHARSLGHQDLPVPLTYLFTLESEAADTLAFVVSLGVDPTAVLHGEQSFSYQFPLHAGDVVELRHALVSDETKAESRMRIIRRRTDVTRAGELACQLSSTWIVRPPRDITKDGNT